MSDFDPIAEDPARPGCEAGQPALHRLLDGEADWDTPEAAAHRATCVECREVMVLARSFVAVLPPAVPSGMAGKVFDIVVRSDRRRRRARYAAVGVAMAASVLVAGFSWQPAPQTVTETRAVARMPQPKEAGTPRKPLGESMSDVRDAIVALTRRAAEETRETSSTLIPNPKLGTMPDAGERLGPLADARSGAARSVEPLTTSARRALNLFLRAADPPNKPLAQ